MSKLKPLKPIHGWCVTNADGVPYSWGDEAVTIYATRASALRLRPFSNSRVRRVVLTAAKGKR
jgi:hypothetical protein